MTKKLILLSMDINLTGREASFAKRIPNNFVTRQALANKVDLSLKRDLYIQSFAFRSGALAAKS